MGKVIEIFHVDTEEFIVCWGVTSGIDAIRSCLRTHPEQQIIVAVTEMSPDEYDALDEYEGEC